MFYSSINNLIKVNWTLWEIWCYEKSYKVQLGLLLSSEYKITIQTEIIQKYLLMYTVGAQGSILLILNTKNKAKTRFNYFSFEDVNKKCSRNIFLKMHTFYIKTARNQILTLTPSNNKVSTFISTCYQFVLDVNTCSKLCEHSFIYCTVCEILNG